MAGTLPFQPLIIIGAGRSGTNILRDVLCHLPEFATWDCDEINPIWRHGNIGHPNDEFSSEMARPEITAFIRSRFLNAWKQFGRPRFLVEKTCANSLRVGFVDAIFPEAKYLFLVRDGMDVVASAQKRWRGELEMESLTYYWAKIRYTPKLDLPIYGYRFIKSRFGMLFGQSEHMSFWGPQFSAMAEMTQASLAEVCARQWVECVEQSSAAFAPMADGKVLKIHYEALTRGPGELVATISDFLGIEPTQAQVAAAISDVTHQSVSKGRKSLGEESEKLMAIMAPTLVKFGYPADFAKR